MGYWSADGSTWNTDDEESQSALIEPQAQAPPPSGALVAPGEYSAPYSDEQRTNPRRQMWASMLGQWGQHFASNGRMGLGDAGMGAMNRAQATNQRMDTANAQAQRQHTQDQNAYANATYGREQNALQQGNWQNTFDANQGYRQGQQDHQSAVLDEQIRANQAKESAAVSKAAQEAQMVGRTPEYAQAVRGLRQEFNKNTGGSREVLASAQRGIEQLKLGTGIGDVASTVTFLKTLDPTSVAREGEVAGVANAGGLLEGALGAIQKNIEGGGQLTPKVRKQLAESLNALVRIEESKYEKRRDDALQYVGNYGWIDPQHVVGSVPSFGSFYDSYKGFSGGGSAPPLIRLPQGISPSMIIEIPGLE